MPPVSARPGHVVLLAFGAGCVPEGPATIHEETLPEQTLHIPEGHGEPGTFSDQFERTELGPHYLALSDAWRIEEGWLCVAGAKNHGLWLTERLPANVSIEFDAVAQSELGDIKVELFGDGKSGATGESYDDATGYIAIFGGWQNSVHVLVKQNEHAVDRQEIPVDSRSDDPLRRPVQAGQPYHFKFERRHGNLLTWSVNGAVHFVLADPEPLSGAGHEHFGFNDWVAPVCFDNLEIKPL